MPLGPGPHIVPCLYSPMASNSSVVQPAFVKGNKPSNDVLQITRDLTRHHTTLPSSCSRPMVWSSSRVTWRFALTNSYQPGNSTHLAVTSRPMPSCVPLVLAFQWLPCTSPVQRGFSSGSLDCACPASGSTGSGYPLVPTVSQFCTAQLLPP